MDEILKNRMDNFYPAAAPSQQLSAESALEQKARQAAKEKVLKEYTDQQTAKQLSKLKSQAIAKARIERIKAEKQNRIDSEAAKEAERKAKLIEAIEVQAAEEEAPQRAIVSAVTKSETKPQALAAAKELLAMQGTTRADMQKLLAALNINMNLQLTKTDTANLLACLLTCNEQQLSALEHNPKVPIAIKIVIKRLKADVSAGNMAALERIWDRVFGKAAMMLELPEQSTAAGIIPNTPISREAYVVIRETLLK